MRHAWHVFISVLMWCLMGYYWYVVAQRQITRDTGLALGVLAAIVLAAVLLTLVWVRHNVRLSARLGQRKGFPARPEPFTHDHLGRPLAAPPLAELRAASLVVVELDEQGRKVYRAADEEAW